VPEAQFGQQPGIGDPEYLPKRELVVDVVVSEDDIRELVSEDQLQRSVATENGGESAERFIAPSYAAIVYV
jgi:hypothetical protein